MKLKNAVSIFLLFCFSITFASYSQNNTETLTPQANDNILQSNNSNIQGNKESSVFLPKVIKQKRQQILDLFLKNTQQFYTTGVGYTMFAAAAIFGIMVVAGICTYKPKREAFEILTPTTFRVTQQTSMSEDERNELIKKNTKGLLTVGIPMVALIAAAGYFSMKNNNVINAAKAYKKSGGSFFVEIIEYNAINEWFETTARNLRTADLVPYLPSVNERLATLFASISQSNSDGFTMKCEFALIVCSLLKLI